MSDDQVNIEVNGVPMKVKKGAMIIQATDGAGMYVPRFCYHEKLSIAANCRMCLVEVEKAPKPLPACATPVTEGMKVFTKSPRAIGAQKATMEFLLINHPLDCPICDQGGECELQDLAMGFGRDISRFNERKRVVKDKNIGPLVSTDMTRCIHCTRCVRFGQEIAGIQELGTTGRGEQMRIDTFVEKSVDHELSGNIIDLCPVGALNNKPFRFHARGWEMTQHEMISPHDGVGANLYGHVLRGKLMRVVPRTNEAVNETWISDRDRYSYEGIYSPDRLMAPMVRREGQWLAVDWGTALEAAASGLRKAVEQHGADTVGALASPSSTVEELYLLQKAIRGLGSGNLDHRLRRQDFRDQDADPVFPWLGMGIDDIEKLDSLLVIGANLRREAPLIAHRVRKAAVRKGARVSFINPDRYDYLFPLLRNLAVPADRMADTLANLPTDILESLKTGERRAIVLGALAMRHPGFASLREQAALLAKTTGAKLGYLAEGANAAGAALAGVLPHREVGGAAANVVGKHARAMLESPLRGYVLMGGIEPQDLGVERAVENFSRAECVVALTPFADEATRRVAHVMLPIGTFAETSGTFVNLAGRWQSFLGAAQPVGESRPGWKVLRVLGNLLDLPGFDHASSEEVRAELQALVAGVQPDNSHTAREKLNGQLPRGTVVDVPMYQIDALVRRAPALQLTREAQRPAGVYPVQPA